MIDLFKLGWRNIFRNKRRTILTCIVIGIGLGSMIFQNGLLKGMIANIFSTASDTFLGEAQVHKRDFLETYDIEKTIANKTELLNYLTQNKNIKAYSERVVALSMLSSPRNGVSAQLYGIDPKEEIKVTKLKKAVKEGDLDFDERSIIIGSKLQELLEVNLNDHIIVTIAEAYTGALAQERFKISGIFNFGDPSLDKQLAFIDINKAQKLLKLDNNIHEVVLKFEKKDLLEPLDANLKIEVLKTDNEILSLLQLVPSLKALLEFSNYGMLIIMIIVFLLVIFIIMNTLFMSLFERMKEFGVLKAIGTKPFQIFSLILIEAGSLGLFSCILGETLGLIVNFILSKIGINYSGIDVGGVTIQEPIYTMFSYEQISIFPLSIFLFILVVSLYPAIYAARIIPINALHKDG